METDEARGGSARDGQLRPGLVVARPALWRQLSGAARVTTVSAPPGSGKTVLLRSWLAEASLAERAAWVPVGPGERDAQRFWPSVLEALRRTVPGSALVQPVTAAPGLDGWPIVERLLSDLAAAASRIWLVIDDVHELDPDTLGQLELLIMRAPPGLRFVLASRHDVRLGLHRLRLEGELSEIRAADLKFTVAETRELLRSAGSELSGPAVTALHERTEGWAAGLRLAALSLAGHPDPERFAAGFSGTDRTVAEYLVAEVLDRQPAPVRRLLLRTSVLERVNGELAGLLAGSEDGDRVLQDLEQAGAFVVSLDPERTWFRYHQMFAGLLRLELRRAAPGEVAELHRAASGWFAGRGYPVEAVRHAQAAGDWDRAARLLAASWPALYLDGQSAAVRELVRGFPARSLTEDAELAALAAGHELGRGSLETAERYLSLAERGSVPAARQGQFGVLLGVARLLRARQRGNPREVAEAAQLLHAAAEEARPHLSDDLRALAMISLGITEVWALSYEEAHRHLEHGIALARRIDRPYLEFTGLAYQAATDILQSLTRAAEYGRQAIELAERHGWTGDPAAGTACRTLGTAFAWQGRAEEAESWVLRAEHVMSPGAEPTGTIGVRYARGILELARGRDADAFAAFQSAERQAGHLETRDLVIPRARAFQLLALARLGDTGRAEEVLAGLTQQQRERADVRIALAGIRLAADDAEAARAELGPVLDSSASGLSGGWMVQAFLLEASAQDMLGDQAAASRVLERALDLAEPDGVVLLFMLHPAPRLLERHLRRRTSHAALVTEILGMLAGERPAPRLSGARAPAEPLSASELRVLRYLPTNLRLPEIASQLYVSPNTVKTQVRSVYAKLGAHSRAEAVAAARDLGLLAPSARAPSPRKAPPVQSP